MSVYFPVFRAHPSSLKTGPTDRTAFLMISLSKRCGSTLGRLILEDEPGAVMVRFAAGNTRGASRFVWVWDADAALLSELATILVAFARL
jgi:hypothetical protein